MCVIVRTISHMINMRGTMLVILGTCIVLGALFFLNTPRNTIVLTDSGFSPRELTINEGDTVTFVNKRERYFWPASDFHPTHTAYPDFDAKKALAPGATWSFRFPEPGIYKYHDHLSPFFFGIVKVKDSYGVVHDNCVDRGGNLACWQDKIFIALAEKGLQGAYDIVSDLYKNEPTFAQSCHFIAHNIGLASYGFYVENPNSIVTPKASACASGFYHGFMEAYLGATGDVVAAGAVCESLKGVLKDDAPDAYLQCYHGIGHGAVEYYLAGGGVLGSMHEVIDSALLACEEASPGEEELFRCTSGLFNGVANFFINNEYGFDSSVIDPLSICESQNETYLESCYGNMNSVLFWAADNNFVKAVNAALPRVNESHQYSLVVYLSGLNAFIRLPHVEFEKVIQDCHSLGAFALPCVEGFAHGLLEHGAPNEEHVQALAFCDSPLLTSAERNLCFQESLGELNEWYGAEIKKNVCATVRADLQKYCE